MAKMNLHAGTLMEFVPKSKPAEIAGIRLGLQHGDLVLIVGWINDMAAVKKMRRPVFQTAIEKILYGSLETDFDISRSLLEKHFNCASQHEIKTWED